MTGYNTDIDPHPVIRISHNLLVTCMTFVHSFIAVGLEAQASAYSFGNNGVIKYLAIFPQINEITSVTSAPDYPSDRSIFWHARNVR